MKGHTRVNTFPRWLKYKKHSLFLESLSTGRDFFCKKVKTKKRARIEIQPVLNPISYEKP
jgi:hypothetical protein